MNEIDPNVSGAVLEAKSTTKKRRRRWLWLVPAVIAALAGWRWWATRLNAVERQLVGIWQAEEEVEGIDALVLLPDRRCYLALLSNNPPQTINDSWRLSWRATSGRLRYSLRELPAATSWQESLIVWTEYVTGKLRGEFSTEMSIESLSVDELVLEFEPGDLNTFTRHRDPELWNKWLEAANLPGETARVTD